MRIADRDGRDVEQCSLFGDGTAVGDDAIGAELQLHVVGETERRKEADQRRQGVIGLRAQALARARVGRHDDREAEFRREPLQAFREGSEFQRRIHVLLAVRADHEEAVALQTEPIHDVGRVDLGTEPVQHLRHVRSTLETYARAGQAR